MRLYFGVLAAILGVGMLVFLGCGGSGGGINNSDATARCVDGRLSYSTTCADVCATNSGVEAWLTSSCQASGAGAVSARAFADSGTTATGDANAARVEVAWQAPSGIQTTSIIEYHVYRDSELVGAVSPGRRVFTDSPAFTSVFPSSFTYQTPGALGALDSKTGTRTAMTAGVAHTYKVRMVYLQDSLSVYRETDLLAVNGPVTPIARPGANGPTGTVDLTKAQIIYQTVTGANQYILEFSADAGFATKVTRGPFTVAPTPNAATTSDPLNLSLEFSGLAAASRIYFRVGARNSGDALPPLSRGTVNGADYIYSAGAISFAK